MDFKQWLKIQTWEIGTVPSQLGRRYAFKDFFPTSGEKSDYEEFLEAYHEPGVPLDWDRMALNISWSVFKQLEAAQELA